MALDPTRALVLQKLRQLFPDEAAFARALRILNRYGPDRNERERVQLGILKLSDGDLGKLEHNVSAALIDYRDILAWAEYPEQMASDPSAPGRRAMISRDRAQYERWIEDGDPEARQK